MLKSGKAPKEEFHIRGILGSIMKLVLNVDQ
jgi:hypothetical protein